MYISICLFQTAVWIWGSKWQVLNWNVKSSTQRSIYSLILIYNTYITAAIISVMDK